MSRPTNHVKVQHGLCPVCGHYGEDCTGGKAWSFSVSVQITEEDLREIGLPATEDGALTLAPDWLKDQIDEGGIVSHTSVDDPLLAFVRACIARINGEWDNPDLLKWGPLSTAHDRYAANSGAEEDILRAALAIIARMEGRAL